HLRPGQGDPGGAAARDRARPGRSRVPGLDPGRCRADPGPQASGRDDSARGVGRGRQSRTDEGFVNNVKSNSVMPALVAGIHVLRAARKTWMPGTRPGMTVQDAISAALSKVEE